MNQTQFDVRRFENRNGSASWRVTGWLNGLRIRKNFKTREEAGSEKAALAIKALQATSGLRSIATPLTDEQVREAEAVFLRLGEKPRTLSFYVDFALTNYKEPESQKSLPDAIADYLAAKRHECEQGHRHAREWLSDQHAQGHEGKNHKPYATEQKPWCECPVELSIRGSVTLRVPGQTRPLRCQKP